MIFHGVNLLHSTVKLDGLGALVDSRAGLLVFKWSLHDVLFGVVLKKFSLLGRVPRSMQHVCLFCTGRRIARMACIMFLALTSVALLGVGRRGAPPPLFLSAKTGTVGF